MVPAGLHELCDQSLWDAGVVHYVPYIGDDYKSGLAGGVRLLLVGESHYEENDLPLNESRNYTLSNFGGYVDESQGLSGKKVFFKRLGELPTCKEDSSRRDIAEVWRRIAFTNYVQRSVGERPTYRPSKTLWASGEAALREIVDRLKPDAILFISKSVWDRVKSGRWSDQEPIAAQRCSRRLWLYPHGAGEALCTWVYHPSWNFETQKSRMNVLSELLRRAAKMKAG